MNRQKEQARVKHTLKAQGLQASYTMYETASDSSMTS